MKFVNFDRGRWRKGISVQRARFAKEQGRIHDILQPALREAARIAAVELARWTFPNRFAVSLLKKSIAMDVRQVFATAGKVYGSMESRFGKGPAGAFYAAFSRGNYRAAADIMLTVGHPWAGVPMGPLQPALHEGARNARGRVYLATPLQIVANDEITAYLPLVYAKMGKTASGFAACAVALGGEHGIPRYKSTSVHGSSGGRVSVMRSGARQVIILKNLRPLARKHISPIQIQRAVTAGRNHLAAELRRLRASR